MNSQDILLYSLSSKEYGIYVAKIVTRYIEINGLILKVRTGSIGYLEA